MGRSVNMRRMKPAEFLVRDVMGFICGIFPKHRDAQDYAITLSTVQRDKPFSVMRVPIEWYNNGELVTENLKAALSWNSMYWGEEPPSLEESAEQAVKEWKEAEKRLVDQKPAIENSR
jgi:hypothetical protein